MSPLRDDLAGFRTQAVGVGFGLGWSALKSVPGPLTAQWFQAAADAATVRNGPATRQLRKNLRRVMGPEVSDWRMDELVGEGMRSYARYWLETFRLPKMDKARIIAKATANTIGAENLDAAAEAGRGIVVALPHMGNYDVAGLWLVNRYRRPFTTVAERLKPESLFDRFVEYRESLGMEVLALTGGERPPMSVLTERLRAGGAVCLVADRDLSRNGIGVDFFGEPTRMPGGPAMLCAMTGAALLPVGLWFTEDGGWGQHIQPPIELGAERLRDNVIQGTQALADRFAGLIRQHPTDWHMVQKLWLSDLPDRPEASSRPGVEHANGTG